MAAHRRFHRARATIASAMGHRRLVYAGAALFAALIVATPIYIFLVPAHQTNQLEEAIRGLHFLPINPPTTLRAPGSIYVINDNGEVDSALCWADAKELKDVLHESPTETRDSQNLRKATFDSSANITKSLKERLKGDLIESVSFTLENVSVLEVSIENLRGLSGTLQKKTECGDSVYAYIKAGQHVCQGQQVLRATAKYTIRTKREVEGEVAAQLTDAVRATIDPKASVDGSTVTSGEGLFYGMRLAPLCMALDDQGVSPPPRPHGRGFIGRMASSFGL